MLPTYRNFKKNLYLEHLKPLLKEKPGADVRKKILLGNRGQIHTHDYSSASGELIVSWKRKIIFCSTSSNSEKPWETHQMFREDMGEQDLHGTKKLRSFWKALSSPCSLSNLNPGSVHLPSAQFSSVAQSCQTLCNPMDHSMSGLPVHHQLPEFTQKHVHWVGDAIQPSHPLSSLSHAFNLSQHQGLFKWVSSSDQVAKVLEFHLQHQSFQWMFRTNSL